MGVRWCQNVSLSTFCFMYNCSLRDIRQLLLLPHLSNETKVQKLRDWPKSESGRARI